MPQSQPQEATDKVETPKKEEIPEVTMAHKKAKEWIVAMARANYQDLSKLLTDYPELVKLHDPFTGYTALHWAAKHGNQDVVKLIAGTHKADVDARSNGGYTPLHISMQFGRADVFELLVNVYKANRDLTDWSGNKPLDYSKQSTSVSPSTFSSEYYNDYYVHEIEPNNNNNWARTLLKGASGSSVRNKKYIPKAYATISPNSKAATVSRAQSLMTGTAPTSRRRPKKALAASLFSPEQDLLEPCEMLSPPTSPLSLQLNKSNNNNNIKSPGTPERRPSAEGGASITSGGSGKSGGSGSGSGSGGATPKSTEKNQKVTKKGTTPRRKESFFRKTLRAAVAGTQTTNKPVTNQLLAE